MFNSACKTVGVRQNEATSDLVKRVAQEALDTKAEQCTIRRRLKELAKNDPVIQAQDAGGRRVDRLRAAGLGGRSARLFLRSRLPQGDGLESQGVAAAASIRAS